MDKILQIAQEIYQKGGRLYLVGGAVRDEIIGTNTHDKDYCVTGLSSKEFLEILPEAKIIGKEFPVFVYEGIEFALARSEKKVSKGYKGFSIITNKNITIEEDLKRRDITINAIAKDVLTGKIVDPYNGIDDIKQKIIRPVSKAFLEDPLRAYRAARFAAKYNFNLAEYTIEMMYKLKDELKTLSCERVFEELKKVLQVAKPSIFFECLKSANILDVHFKEIYDLINVPQPKEYHPEGDVFNHTMIVLDKVAYNIKDESIRFAALCHDFGKALTPSNILPQHIDHDVRGEHPINSMCDRLKLPNDWRKKAIFTSKYHMKVAIIKQMRPFKQAKLLNIIKKSPITLEQMEIIVNADEMLNRGKVEFADIAKIVFSKVNGKTLNQKGITVQSIGKERFIIRLLEEQALLIKEIESKEK